MSRHLEQVTLFVITKDPSRTAIDAGEPKSDYTDEGIDETSGADEENYQAEMNEADLFSEGGERKDSEEEHNNENESRGKKTQVRGKRDRLGEMKDRLGEMKDRLGEMEDRLGEMEDQPIKQPAQPNIKGSSIPKHIHPVIPSTSKPGAYVGKAFLWQHDHYNIES